MRHGRETLTLEGFATDYDDYDDASVCRTVGILEGLGSRRMLIASTLGTGSRTTLIPLPLSREMLPCLLSGKRVSIPCRSHPLSLTLSAATVLLLLLNVMCWSFVPSPQRRGHGLLL
jgi:hypothetical protein